MAAFKGYTLSKHTQHAQGQSAELTPPRNDASGQRGAELCSAGNSLYNLFSL